MLAVERRHRIGKDVDPDRRVPSDPDPAGAQTGDVLDRLLSVADHGQDPPSALVQGLADSREHGRPASRVEQRLSDRAGQRLHLVRDRRLRQRQDLGGASEAAVLDHAGEDAELAQGDAGLEARRH